jgi:molybdopterin-guanine dinucleotide biosynthesis protein A
VTARQLAGLVLCGGTGRRMGRDKALVEFESEPLVVRAARRLGEVADPVLLAPGRTGRLGDLGYREVADAAEDAGPLAGIVAGVTASPHELVAVVAADMPFASPALFAQLAALRGDEDAVVPVVAGNTEPLHAVYARSSLPALRDALQERRFELRAVLRSLRRRDVLESEWLAVDPTGRFAFNLNRPEDLSVPGTSRILGGRTETSQ